MFNELERMISKFHVDVVNETSAKIRTFLYELAERTPNYKSLHNLTEQVEHQYHGRFLIELMQNAHDALHEKLHEKRLLPCPVGEERFLHRLGVSSPPQRRGQEAVESHRDEVAYARIEGRVGIYLEHGIPAVIDY